MAFRLAGRSGQARAEISFILGRLSDLESLTRQVPHLHESEHGEISSTNYQYARSARENLQHAGAESKTGATASPNYS